MSAHASLSALDTGPFELRRPVPVEHSEFRFPREHGPSLHVVRWPEAGLEACGGTVDEALVRLGRQASAIYALAERRRDGELGPTLLKVKQAMAAVVQRRRAAG